MEIKLTAVDQIRVPDGPQPTYGWGEDATELYLEGEVREIQIHSGSGRISIRIEEDGTLHICDHGGTCYRQNFSSNLTLDPYRPWNCP